jgi:uncharacterized protein (DUF58 family)
MATPKPWRRWFNNWLERRLPRVKTASLTRKNIFTFPSRTGWMFAGVLILLWLLATNYQNNLVFGFSALLGALLIVSIFHGYANLSGLQLRVLSVDHGFPGDQLRVEVELSHPRPRRREDIHLLFPDGDTRIVSLSSERASITVALYLDARRRGRRHVDRITIETSYPLGLIRVWSYLNLAGYGLVYPRPVAVEAVASGETGDSSTRSAEVAGSEDFSGLRDYRNGESLNRIAWKQFARGQTLLSKQFVDPIADPQWLDWQQFPGMDREARLSRLCHQVLKAARAGYAFGLRLPGQCSDLGVGDAHRDRLLAMLAVFEIGDAA